MFGGVRTATEFAPSLIQINTLHGSKRSLIRMLSLTRYPPRTSQDGRPQGLRGFARVAMLVAGAVFLLNTALFPCCEVAAAVLGGHADSGSPSTAAAPPPPHAEAEHSETPHHGPDSLCDSTLATGPALVGEFEVLAPDRSPLEGFAVDALSVTSLTSVSGSEIIALARASPQRSLRFYLRTQRLLI